MATTTAATLLSSLPPLKRILCLCPLKRQPKHDRKLRRTIDNDASKPHSMDDYHVSLAVTDPYLSQSLPVVSSNPLLLSRVLEFQDPRVFLERVVEYPDVAAVLLSPPLKSNDTRHDNNHQDKDDTGSYQALQQHIRQYFYPDLEFLVLDHPPSLKRAQQLAHENPEMWDEIDSLVAASSDPHLLADNPPILSPSDHAAIALDVWLWDETGGWGSNTFG